MTAFGHVELTAEELPDELRFRVDREYGWFTSAVLTTVSVAGLIVSSMVSDRGTRFGIAITAGTILFFTAIATLFALKHPRRTTQLSVTREYLVATGAGLGWTLPWSSSKVMIAVSTIKSLDYITGQDDTGLYLRCGSWARTCVLPGLHREQTKSVIDAILRRFPEIGSTKP